MGPVDQLGREVLISNYRPVGEESIAYLNRRMETFEPKGPPRVRP